MINVPRTLHSQYVAAVTVTAAHDYAPEQIAAWARPGARSLGDWNRSMLARASLVAVRGGAIAGFSDVNGEGYIDMMFVAPAHARRGVASALLAAVFERARDLGATGLWANVSVTARPFFAARGFKKLEPWLEPTAEHRVPARLQPALKAIA